ncbi:MAG: hypothetical protein DBY16_11440 [Coprobacter sp.]|nr:MAG: hypothetical protein DBY16_11395 [Coprobacter sp.]PWM89177.1 MAG: hypothetical protein DBY16_11440 [Coprobacter sp.]
MIYSSKINNIHEKIIITDLFLSSLILSVTAKKVFTGEELYKSKYIYIHFVIDSFRISSIGKAI